MTRNSIAPPRATSELVLLEVPAELATLLAHFAAAKMSGRVTLHVQGGEVRLVEVEHRQEISWKPGATRREGVS